MRAQLWILTATRAALPADGASYETFKQLTREEFTDNAAAYLMWLLAELGAQTGDLDLQVLPPTSSAGMQPLQEPPQTLLFWLAFWKWADGKHQPM